MSVFYGCGGRIWTNDLRVMRILVVVATSETSDEGLHLPSHFRRPFADENPQRCPRKSCHFCFLPGKSTKVSGNPSPQGETLGKNKRCKFQDKRQQSGRTLAKFPDSLKNLWEETKIKNTAKIAKSDYPLEEGETLVKTHLYVIFNSFRSFIIRQKHTARTHRTHSKGM